MFQFQSREVTGPRHLTEMRQIAESKAMGSPAAVEARQSRTFIRFYNDK